VEERQPAVFGVPTRSWPADGNGWTPIGPTANTWFDEFSALVYECCTPTAHSVARIVRALREDKGLDVDEDRVRQALDEFTVSGLMLEENGVYLSLAVPVNPNW
jgi:hypothetical protein